MSTLKFAAIAFFSFSTLNAAVGVRLVLGLTDKESANWDGSVSANGARILSIEGWRFDNGDAMLPDNTWKMSTHNARQFGGMNAQRPPITANGIVVWLDNANDNAGLDVKTTQGNFKVALRDIPYGKLVHALGDRAMADRIPFAERLTNTPDEQDLPAAALAPNGDICLAYMEFRHHPDHDKLRANMQTAPADIGQYGTPALGDQIFFRKRSGGAWSENVSIADAGGDYYRPAIAVDGSGRAWVFWPSNQKQNFDLWARPVDTSGKPGAPIRLTTEAGSDLEPVAATDSKGKVWVAWQAWRDGKAKIMAAVQEGNGFSKPVAVSSSAGNEWNPAIAADKAGHVSIAWDSYRNGNYDIYVRTTTGAGRWEKAETALAATPRYEAYPSLAYDNGGRLWAAYEEGGEGWGKDFGAYEVGGVSIYQGRAVRIKGIDGSGRIIELTTDVGTVLPGPPVRDIDSTKRQSDSEDWLRPNRANNRAQVRDERRPPAPKNSMPRLQFDGSGRLWLAMRSVYPVWWNSLGHVWSEHVVSFDGKTWTGPIFLQHSDDLLDNRPALLSTAPGSLTVIGSSDGRRQWHVESQQGENSPGFVKDPYQNDLYLNTVELTPATGSIEVRAASAPAAPPARAEAVETNAIAAMRNYRGPDSKHIVRGEFHRHSEISMDGGAGDGMLIDQWRYIIDAAALDWVGCCDHDNGAGREYTWWLEQKATDMFYTPGKFSPLFSYERSVAYPEGHRNVLFAQRGIRTLPRLPRTAADNKVRAPDTQMLYAYLKRFKGIAASHTSATNMGTDWRDNDPDVEPIVEIYQGDRQNYEMPGAPRTIVADDAIGGFRPAGFVNLALEQGYRLGFESSSDHVSTHMSYSNVIAPSATRESLLQALRERHVYGSTDNILADVRSGSHIMGDSFTTDRVPSLSVKLQGTAPFTKVHVIKDNKYVYSTEPKAASVNFTWRDQAAEKGKTSYYYVRGEQENGELVWVSPMWITYR